jgi:hypothetical protein
VRFIISVFQSLAVVTFTRMQADPSVTWVATNERVAYDPLQVPLSVGVSQGLNAMGHTTVGVGLNVRVKVEVAVGVRLGVRVKVAVGKVPVEVAVGVPVAVAVRVGVDVRLAVALAVGVWVAKGWLKVIS